MEPEGQLVRFEGQLKRLTWDETKRRSNTRKHRIDFSELVSFFRRPHLREFDAEHSDREERWRLLGLLGDKVVVVVIRDDPDAIRVISTRPANRRDAQLNYERFFGDPR